MLHQWPIVFVLRCLFNILIMIVDCFFCHVYATEWTKNDGFYQLYKGDGLETEIQFTVESYAGKPSVKVENNDAACKVISIAPLASPSNVALSDSNSVFAVRIHVEVEGDSGGCVLIARSSSQSNSEILKIFNYTYVTDY